MSYKKKYIILVTYFPEYGTNQQMKSEVWENLRSFCNSKGWKYNTYVLKGDTFRVDNILVERKKINR